MTDVLYAFDLRPIIKNFYCGIFRDEARSNSEAYILVFLPIILSAIGLFRHIDQSFISTMSAALAILFGFTFTSLLTTAGYSSGEEKIEAKVVQESRSGTSYALLVNLSALICVIFVSIYVVNYNTLSYAEASFISAIVYALLFHYLLVMLYLMRYLYLLAVGGAFEER